VSLDKINDTEEGCGTNLIFGTVGVAEEKGKLSLLMLDVLKNINNSTIVTLYNSICIVTNCSLYKPVQLVCTDTAPYMTEPMGG
jgi:hypothetical protein